MCSLNGTEIRQDDTPAARLTSCYFLWQFIFINNWTRFFPQLIWQRTAVTWSLVWGCSERKCPAEQSWSFSIYWLLETHITAALRCRNLVHHQSVSRSLAHNSILLSSKQDCSTSVGKNLACKLYVRRMSFRLQSSLTSTALAGGFDVLLLHHLEV